MPIIFQLPELQIEPDEYAVTEDGTLNVSAVLGLLDNDFSSNGSLSVESYTSPQHGTLEIFSNGSFDYIPDAGYTGTDTFTYTITDGLFTQTATDTIAIYHAAPIAVSDVYTVQAGHTLDVSPVSGLLANDIDLNTGTLVVESFIAPDHGTLGVFTSGSVVYVPDASFVGQDGFSYTETDGTAQATASVTIDVTDPPPAANAGNYTVRAGQTLTVSSASGLLINDVGYTGTLYVESFTSPNHGTLSVTTAGSFVYVPDAGFTGGDSFTYTDFDGVRQSTGTITVQVVDDAPVAQNDYFVVSEGGTLDVSAASGLLANDYDPDGDSLRAQSFTSPNHGTLSVTTSGSFDYTPDAGYVGTDTFTYTISDGVLDATATATIDVTGHFFTINGELTANPDAYSVGENGSLNVSATDGLLANDFSSNGSLSVESFTSPSHGTLEIFTTGSFDYTPDSGYTGSDSFTYTITNGNTQQTATDTIAVYHAAPIAVADVYTVQAGHTLNVAPGLGLLANDIDLNTGTLTVESFVAPDHGTLSVFTSGSIVYVPDAGFVGQDGFSYTETDGTAQATGSVTIDVTDPPPVANADNFAVRAGQTLSISAAAGLLANDVGYTGTLEVESFTSPSHGTLSVLTTGALTYVPDAGFVGTDTATYTDTDSVQQTTGTITIQVVDDAPVAQPDHYEVGLNGTLDVSATYGLLANDYDPDGDALTATSFIAPSHGTLSVTTSGSFNYVPDAGYIGSDSFNYTITDGVLDASATVSIDVLCFCHGSRIRTPAGLVPVEQLAAGDLIVTWSGAHRAIVWIGRGLVLATRAWRSAATPVIIHKGAFAPNVPARDLRVTKGHSFLFDNVLIPVEFLVNHRSILWDDRAQEVEVFHVELDSHDVLDAEGAPAESYRDDGNRWLFRNPNPGWHLPPQPPCVPIRTGGPVVDAVWRRLLDRAGPRRNLQLTDDADLHVEVDGQRLNALRHAGGAYVFQLPAPPASLRIVSRSAVPAELGLARDPRALGVAVRRIVVRKGTRFRTTEASDTRLSDGFHTFEAENGYRWTDGNAGVPAELFEGFTGRLEVVLHVAMTTRYLDDGRVQHVA